jgi:hypothetical protein
MVVRTRIYPFEIVLPEVIDDVKSAPKEYIMLLEEAIGYGKEIRPCRQVFNDDSKICSEPVLCCPICGFEYMHVPAVALVTYSACIITTKDGTKIIRSEGLGERISRRGWRLVMFCECESGHVTKIMFQFHKGNIYLLYDKIDKQKWRTIIKGDYFNDISRW